jgi:hypothetical protein
MTILLKKLQTLQSLHFNNTHSTKHAMMIGLCNDIIAICDNEHIINQQQNTKYVVDIETNCDINVIKDFCIVNDNNKCNSNLSHINELITNKLNILLNKYN